MLVNSQTDSHCFQAKVVTQTQRQTLLTLQDLSRNVGHLDRYILVWHAMASRCLDLSAQQVASSAKLTGFATRTPAVSDQLECVASSALRACPASSVCKICGAAKPDQLEYTVQARWQGSKSPGVEHG